MRQNPITSRIQVGGRQMPSWFSASLIRDGARRPSEVLQQPPPPPPNVPPPQEESEYEEIDHLPRYTNTNIKKPTATKKTCSLCGNGNPVVRCELCNNQIFCGSCNDMYHRHPKRHNHVRKILETVENRPPLPPKTMTPPIPSIPDAPIPPPRRVKKFGIRSATSSPTLMRKVFFDPMGSLKRQFGNGNGVGMEQRPLPPPPKPAPPLPPKSDISRLMDGRQRQNSGPQHPQHQQQQHFQNSHHPTASQSQLNRHVPLTALEMASQRRNLMSREDIMQSPWDDFNGRQFSGSDTMRPRAQSVSTNQLNRFNSSSNISHIATLQRKPKRPIVCGPVRPPPPPIPPREAPPSPSLHSHHPNGRGHHSIISASAFNLNQLSNDMDFEDQQMGMGMTSPWMSPYPLGYPQQQQHQHPHQQQMMFYPGNNGHGHGYPGGPMKRTPSTSSMTAGERQQPMFNPWSTMRNNQMTSSERELEMIGAGRRGSETRLDRDRDRDRDRPPPYGNQMQMQMQMQMSPRNQNNAGGHQGHAPNQNRSHFLDSADEFNLMNLNRDRSMSPSARIRQERELFQFELQRRESMSRESNPRERERDRDRDRRERSGSTAGGTTVVDGYWTCEWCTLINSVESNICSACCKTSTLVRNLKQQELDLDPEVPVGAQSPISSPPPSKSRSRSSHPSPSPAPVPTKKKVSGGKGVANEGSSGKKSSNPAPIIHSVLSFSRKDKENKTSARLEKQIIKMVDDDEASDSGSGSDEEDDEVPGDTDSESQGSEPDSEENDEDDSDEDEDEDEEVEVVPSPVPVPVSMVVHVSPNVHANAHTNHRDNFRTGNHAHRKKSMSRERRPKTPLTSSNEEVYGSIPLQTLTIATTPSGTSTVFSGSSSSSSNKRDRDRDVKEPKKQQVSTGVGSSPPSPAPKYLSGNLKKETYPRTATTTTATEDSDRDYSRNGVNKSSSQASSEGSSSPTKPIKMKPALKKMSSVESSASNKSKSGPNLKSTGASSTSTATTTATAGVSTSTSTSIQDLSIISPALTVAVGIGVGTGTGNGTPLVETSSKPTSLMKTSKGTSPPPQSISTQTYEELPAGKLELKSVSKTSLVAAIDLLDQEEQVPSGVGGRTVKEMSDKELRYSRRSQQQSKLKRSMSTHLTSAVSGDPWMEANEGRHLYRSSSRHSLASDTRSLPLSGPPSRDASPPRGRFYREDFRAYPPPSWDRFPTPADYFASIEDLVNRRRKDSSRNQEFELARLLKEAAESGFTPEDVQVALRMCGERNPIKWLQDNWSNMVETVQTLATKYGREKGDERNEVGTISTAEAKEALRQHRGNVWVAVTECVEQRRKKFLELQARGNFLREDILTSLTANHGKLDSAYVELSKAQLKPFLMQIWGPPIGLDNEAAPPKRYSSPSTSSGSTASSFSPNSDPGVSNNSDGGKQQQQQQQQQQPLQQNQNQLIEQEMDNSKLYEEVNPTNPGANLNAKETQPSPSLGQLEGQNRDEVQNVDEQVVGTRTQQPDYVRSNSLSEDQSDDHFMDATEGEGMIAITIDENLTESETKEDIGSSSDQEESEAFVSDFLQNFQINRNAAPNNKSSKTDHPTPTPDVLPSSAGVIPTDIGIDTTEDSIYAPHSVSTGQFQSQSQNEIPGGSGRRMTDPAPSGFGNEGKLVSAVGQGASFQTPIQLNPTTITTTEGAEKLVENKLHFSMEAVLELLEQQRIKIMKEAEVEKNKELYATTSAASGPGTTSTITNQAPLPTSTLEPLSSSNVKVGQEKTLKENFEAKPKERGVGKKQSLNPVTTSKKDINPAEENEKNGADGIMRNSSSTTGSGKNVRSQVLHAQGSVESTDSIEAEFEGEADVDASIYEEVDNGDNLSLTEYINRAMVPQDDDEDMDDESLEDETSIGDDEDADLSIESSGSIGTHSDMDPDDLLEEIYEKIQQPVQEQQPQPSDLDLEPFASESTEDAGEIQQVVPTAAVAQEKAETKPLPSPTPTPGPAPVAEPVVVKVVKEVKPEVKRLMDEGLSDCFEHAELAVQLMDMKFTEEDSVHAAKECNSIYQALSYLQQECLLCTGKFSATHMISMLRCTHWCCKTCARDYFMVQIRDHGILDATCPFCKEPSQLQLLEDPDVAVDYFNHLDILLKNLLDYKHHEMFQRKLRDYTLSNTPNFKWCSKCSSGFITEPMQTRLVCPDCSAVTCAVCLEPWDRTHDHRDQNTVKLCDDATKSIVDYLNENCVECPRCRLKFFLARGGCMHLTCSQCKFEFCSGCSAPFRLSTKCNDGPFCLKLGLHAHHPRNCLFYLRDKDPPFLAKLLEDHAIPYLSEEVIEESQTERRRRCRVSIQKETEAGLQDDICGNDAPPGFATVCQGHYIEYLGLLIWQNRLDPISILSNDDLETIVKRAHKKTPHRLHGTKDADFRVKLLQVIQDEIPL